MNRPWLSVPLSPLYLWLPVPTCLCCADPLVLSRFMGCGSSSFCISNMPRTCNAVPGRRFVFDFCSQVISQSESLDFDMAKLVILTGGLTGLTHELSVNPTTVGRAEGNLLQIIEPAVSGRHCEILLRGNEVVVRDLKSTNGTFIQGERITEAILKPGRILRLGRVDLRLEASTPVASPAPSAPSPSAPAPFPPRT